MTKQWTEWYSDGSPERPLIDYIWCEVMYLDGIVEEGFAQEFDWDAIDVFDEIIAYNIPEPSAYVQAKIIMRMSEVT